MLGLFTAGTIHCYILTNAFTYKEKKYLSVGICASPAFYQLEKFATFALILKLHMLPYKDVAWPIAGPER